MSFFSSLWSDVVAVWDGVFGNSAAASRAKIVGYIQTALAVVHTGLIAVEQQGLIGSNDRANIEKAFADAQALCGALTSAADPTSISKAINALNVVVGFMPDGQAKSGAMVAISVASALLPAIMAAADGGAPVAAPA